MGCRIEAPLIENLKVSSEYHPALATLAQKKKPQTRAADQRGRPARQTSTADPHGTPTRHTRKAAF